MEGRGSGKGDTVKRTIFVLCFVASLVVAGVPASAGGGGHQVTVDPNPVKQGESLSVTSVDCVDGPDWEAKLHIKITKNGHQKLSRTVDTDGDGTTVEKIKMRKTKFKPGEYTISVKCKHHFDDGTVGTWYRDARTFRVEKAD
jgi:5-hydroxyisourate hydrolase-like protein (transthyretin family)